MIRQLLIPCFLQIRCTSHSHHYHTASWAPLLSEKKEKVLPPPPLLVWYLLILCLTLAVIHTDQHQESWMIVSCRLVTDVIEPNNADITWGVHHYIMTHVSWGNYWIDLKIELLEHHIEDILAFSSRHDATWGQVCCSPVHNTCQDDDYVWRWCLSSWQSTWDWQRTSWFEKEAFHLRSLIIHLLLIFFIIGFSLPTSFVYETWWEIEKRGREM